MRYSVRTRGTIVASVGEFRRLAQQTYEDPRGWRAKGVRFVPVARGGSFTLWLAAAGTVPGFSSGCSSMWSCRVGRNVIINQTRWRFASPAWNAAHRSLRDYRHMVVNHETGHWLGKGHARCPGKGRLAPVMMQQSKGTHGMPVQSLADGGGAALSRSSCMSVVPGSSPSSTNPARSATLRAAALAGRVRTTMSTPGATCGAIRTASATISPASPRPCTDGANRK